MAERIEGRMTLLDLIAVQMKRQCLSDLRTLTAAERYQLANKLEQLPAKEEALKDWNNALTYLTDTLAEQTSLAAKNKLIALLLNQNK